MNFPEHKCGLYLTHNEHKDSYQTIENFIADKYEGAAGYEPTDDITPEDAAACIATNEIWELQWYPETPVGSYCVAGPTLERVLALAAEVEEK